MFCVYVTKYSGDCLPPFYIGSSSVARIQKGYHGTVKSKKFGAIWREELRMKPELFETTIISTFETRIEATSEELRLQQEHQVVTNPLFINESYATVNGFFTMEKSGPNNPMFGRKHTDEAKQKISEKAQSRIAAGWINPLAGKPLTFTNGMLNRKHTAEAKTKMREKQQARLEQNNYWQGVKGEDHPAYGYKHSEEFIASQKIPKPKVTCPHCGKSGGKPAMLRFHFERCRSLG